MRFRRTVNEKDLLKSFPKIQERIKKWEGKYSLPEDLLPIESEDRKPFIVQPFYTYQIHAVS